MIVYKAKKKGLTGLLEVAYECYVADKKKDFMLDRSGFTSALNRAKLDLGPQEIDSVFNYLESSSNPGLVDYESLVRDLKEGGLPQARRDMIADVFAKLDYKGAEVIDLRTLVNLFNAKNHYDVKGGRRTQDEMDLSFREAVHLYTQMNNGTATVDFLKFVDFWEYISPTILNENNFETLLRTAFRFNELPNRGQIKGKVNPKDEEVFNSHRQGDDGFENSRMMSQLENVRSQLAKGGPKKFITFYQMLKHNDHDHDGKLACKEFIKSFNDLRISMPEAEIIALFQYFDKKSSGFLDVPQFLCTFIPELNPMRLKVVQDLLSALAAPSNQQIILLSNVKKFFFPRGHPDFLQRKRPDYEIKDEFINMVNTFLGLSGGATEQVPRDIMLQFFEMMSNAYSNDTEFTDTLIGSFRMDKICTGSRPASSHLDNYSNADSVSVQRSRIQHPFGTQEDIPGAFSKKQIPSMRGGAPDIPITKDKPHYSQYDIPRPGHSQAQEHQVHGSNFNNDQQPEQRHAHGDRPKTGHNQYHRAQESGRPATQLTPTKEHIGGRGNQAPPSPQPSGLGNKHRINHQQNFNPERTPPRPVHEPRRYETPPASPPQDSHYEAPPNARIHAPIHQHHRQGASTTNGTYEPTLDDARMAIIQQ